MKHKGSIRETTWKLGEITWKLHGSYLETTWELFEKNREVACS